MRIRALIVFAALFLGAAPAWAGHDGVQPLDRILSHLRSERGGTFYDADGPFDDGNGGMHYRIKWLTPDGRLIWLDTDARTGRVFGVDQGNFRDKEAPVRDRDEDGDRHNGHGDQFDNQQDPDDHQPREDFPRDPRWPRWQNGAPVGGGHWQDRWRDREGGGRWQGGHGDGGGHRGDDGDGH